MISEPFGIILNGQKSTLDGVHPIYMPNHVRMDPNIILIGQTPSRMLFNPTDTPDTVRTIWNNFLIVKNRNCMIFTHLHSGCARILFYCKVLRIGIYSIRLTFGFGPNHSEFLLSPELARVMFRRIPFARTGLNTTVYALLGL